MALPNIAEIKKVAKSTNHHMIEYIEFAARFNPTLLFSEQVSVSLVTVRMKALAVVVFKSNKKKWNNQARRIGNKTNMIQFLNYHLDIAVKKRGM